MLIKKIRLYFNISLIVLITASVLIFLLSNRDVVEVKFLGWSLWTSPLYVLIFASSLLGILMQIVIRRVRQVTRQLKELKKTAKTEK